jgi:hypothetical protein
MKIVRKEDNVVEFGKLARGDCFEYNNKVYIKIVELHNAQYLGNDANSFNLTYNGLHYFAPGLRVRRLNMELREV